MAQFVNMHKVELSNGTAPVVSLKQIYYGDEKANRVGAFVFLNGLPATLGGTCSGTAILADGSTVALTGTVSGNEAYVVLPSGCYSVEGEIRVFVKLTVSGVTTTLLAAVGTVRLTETDRIIDPGTIIPSVAALITQIENAVASIPPDYTDLLKEITPHIFSTESTYVIGDYVWYNEKLYRANGTFTGGSWDATLFDPVAVMDSSFRTVGGNNVLVLAQKQKSAAQIVYYDVGASLAAHVGETVTVSFDIKSSAGRKARVYAYQGIGISIADTFYAAAPTYRFNHAEFTTTVKDYGGTGDHSGRVAFYDDGGSETITVENFKIELGEHATPFEMSAQDVDEKLQVLDKSLYIPSVNKFTWVNGSVNGSNGSNVNSGTSTTTYIRAEIRYRGLLQVNDGRIGIYVYDSENTYMGFWTGSSFRKENNTTGSVIHSGRIDLSKIVPEGGRCKLVYCLADTSEISPAAGTNVQLLTFLGDYYFEHTYAEPEMYGAFGDGTHDDTAALQAALDSGKRLVLLRKGLRYRTTAVLRIPSGVIFDLNGSTIFGDMANPDTSIIQNAEYGGSGVQNIALLNGTIEGTGAAGRTSDKGHAIRLWIAENVVIRDITTVNSCGDGIAAREANNVIVENVTIGDYGRNGISPTSGQFTFTNVNVIGPVITGADPGLAFDAEINNAAESFTGIFNNCSFKDMTFVDFHSEAGAYFPYTIIFNNVKLLTGAYNALRFKATNQLVSRGIVVDKVRVIGGTSSSAIQIDNISGIVIDGALVESTTPTGTNTRGITTNSPATFRDLDLSAFAGSGRGIRGNLANCIFENVKTRIYLDTGTLENARFVDCIISSFEQAENTGIGTGNVFIGTDAPYTLTSGSFAMLEAKRTNFGLEPNESVSITASGRYGYLIMCQGSQASGYALYSANGYGMGSARNRFNKIIGADLLTASYDGSSAATTITNTASYSISISILYMVGTITNVIKNTAGT